MPAALGLLALSVFAPAWAGAATFARAWLMMGTALEITLEAPDEAAASVAFDRAWRAVARVDSLMSLYREESELVRLNRAPTGTAVPVSAETFAVLRSALRWSGLSGGAFDVTIKPAMDAWGFYRRATRAPTPHELDTLRARIGWRWIDLDETAGTVCLRRPGMAIDLGGIAKGFAVDRACGALRAAGIERALVNLGGNLRALGAPSDTPAGWPVGVRHPLEPDSLLAVFALRDGAMASSGAYETSVVVGGERVGHILDPRSATPVRGVAGTSVTAPDALTADVLSTTLFVQRRVDPIIRAACPAGAFLVGYADGTLQVSRGSENTLDWIAGIQNHHYIEVVGTVRGAGNPETTRSGWGKGTASSTCDGRQTDLP